MAGTEISVRKTSWKGRPGYRLTNGEVQITALTGGGSIAELRSKCGPEQWSPNLLWEAPWTTMDPGGFQPRHERQYGTPFVGKFLAPFTGHVVCLDYFGAPSQEEKACGLTLHGEACVARWKVTPSPGGVTMQARLPFAGLDLRREVRLLKGESAIYVSETVINRKPVDHLLHWVQHVTLGPPFLASSESSIAAPAKQGKTWPHGYEGRSLLADDRRFRWPMAPREGGGSVDLSRPFTEEGKGFVAATAFDTTREWAFVAVLNFRLCLLLASVFPGRRIRGSHSGKKIVPAQGLPGTEEPRRVDSSSERHRFLWDERRRLVWEVCLVCRCSGALGRRGVCAPTMPSLPRR